jgi:RNA polymerase sigma-70 factor, ECF subfamily
VTRVSEPTLRNLTPVEDERSVLVRAAAGDEAAVRVLYRAHVAKLHRHAARILGAHDPDVEDVVQQAFLAALDGAAKFDGRSSVQTWLFGIVTRRALDAARARYRRQRFSRLAEAVGFGPSASASPDRGYQAATEADRALAQLAPMQRVVFVMHDVEGYTHEEIGTALGIQAGTSKAQLFRARAKLRTELADFAGEWAS